jgi:hypothetical protein
MIARSADIPMRLLTITLLLSLVLPALAGDKETMTIDARLIWGTNDRKSPDPRHKAVNPELARKLQNCLKWENYFLVNEQLTNIAVGSSKAIKMSEHCTVEVKNLGKRRMEVRLIGDGKVVGNTNYIDEGRDLILGGDAENNTAWFVLLRSSGPDADKPAKDNKKPSPDKKDSAAPGKDESSKDKQKEPEP